MKPADIAHLHGIGAPSLSPDGSRAVFSVVRPDLEEDAYLGSLWTVATDGSEEPRRLTRGDRDRAPLHSPDGRWIAFLRPDENERPQLHVLPTEGGDPWRITDHPLGVSGHAWSPDSTRLAYNARIPEDGRYVDVVPGKEPPRRISTLKYQFDGLGYYTDRWQHIFVGAPIDPSGEAGEPTRVTTAEADHGNPIWTPDGTTLVFGASLHEDRDLDLYQDVWACAPEAGAELRRVTRGDLNARSIGFSEDGATVYFVGDEIGSTGRDFVGRQSGLWSVPLDGSEAPARLTGTEDPRMTGERAQGIDRGALVLGENRGAVELYLVSSDGERTTLLGGKRQVQSFDHAGGVTVAVAAGERDSGELYLVSEDGPRALTSFFEGVDPLPVAEVTAQAPDGYPVHGWLAVPEGEGPHPVLLMIHGGPFAQYGHWLFDETQVYAKAGYAVAFCNPRGSSGYGQEHGRAIIGSVGASSSTDLLAFLDEVLRDERLDSSRVGVLGGSHGGFMTTWLAGNHGERFRAAISERAVNAIDSFRGSSDIGAHFVEPLYGPRENWVEQSPITYADRIDMPFLIIHSEQDWRCPLEQAQRLFVELKKRGHETEMLVFPGEGHELSRSGLPSHRVARFEAILDWWDRHL